MDLAFIMHPLLDRLLFLFGLRRQATSDKEYLYSVLRHMVQRGLPLSEGVRELSRGSVIGAPGPRFIDYRPYVIYLADTLEYWCSKGATLGEAMHNARFAFHPYESALVRAGERAGTLVNALAALQEYFCQARRLRVRFWSNFIYPGVIFAIVVSIVTLMVVFVVARLREIYWQMGAALPPLTDTMISVILMFYRNLVYPGVLIVAGLVALLIMLRRSLLFYCPLIGRWRRQIHLAEVFMLLGLQLKGGVPVDEAVANLEMLGAHLWARRLNLRLRRTLARGEPLGETILQARLLPPDAAAPVILASQTGQLPDALIEVARQQMELARQRLETFGRALEPLLVTTIAASAGVFIVSMYLPLFNLVIVLQ
ncbi:MAG: hypothetical protein Kow0059_08800 [Candidatus Sumerlaeia bacterium]